MGPDPAPPSKPRALILWGALIAAAGLAGPAWRDDLYGITLAFALASLGFGFARPGFTGGRRWPSRWPSRAALPA